jgi:catechol-2,3-dioxygenase
MGLHRVVLGVTDLGQAVDFYHLLWGLGVESTRPGLAVMRSPGTDHPDVILVQAEMPGLIEMGLAVSDMDSLTRLRDAAAKAGSTDVSPIGPDDYADGTSVRFSDQDGNRVALIVPAEPVHTRVRRPALGPTKLGHVVFWSMDRGRAERFYEALGFIVSDRTAIGMSFLRCNHDHHSLALASGSRQGFQHLAFEVPDIDILMKARARLEQAGHRCIWGTGRHGPGNNIFTYYQDPADNIVEFYTELEQCSEAMSPSEPRYWDETHKGDIWGVAGQPPAQFRS